MEKFTPPNSEEIQNFGVTWDDQCHGFDGAVSSSYTQWHYPQNSKACIQDLNAEMTTDFYFLQGLFLDGMESLGIRRVFDPFCDPMGAYMSPHTLDHNNQSRCDARIAYYDPIFGENGTPRSNLHVLLENTATKIITSELDGVVRVTSIEVSI